VVNLREVEDFFDGEAGVQGVVVGAFWFRSGVMLNLKADLTPRLGWC